MGRHNNPYWNTLLQQSSGLKAREIAPEISPEIQPVVIVDDLRNAADPGTFPANCAVTFALTSTTGLLAAAYISNPLGSQFLIEVLRCAVTEISALNRYLLALGPQPPGTAQPPGLIGQTGVRLNSSGVQIDGAGAVVQAGNAAGGLGAVRNFDSLGSGGAGTGTELTREFFQYAPVVLRPGQWFGIQAVALLAGTDQGHFYWRERSLVRG